VDGRGQMGAERGGGVNHRRRCTCKDNSSLEIATPIVFRDWSIPVGQLTPWKRVRCSGYGFFYPSPVGSHGGSRITLSAPALT
jgi:hypothetical protein